MEMSSEGILFLKQEEGFRATPYKDGNGFATIGFGHKVKAGECFGAISSVEATALLERDLAVAEKCINDNVHVPITQSMFDALCSFVYNIGCAGFMGSQVLFHLNNKEYDLAADAFMNWHRPNLEGRRKREIALFKGDGNASWDSSGAVLPKAEG